MHKKPPASIHIFKKIKKGISLIWHLEIACRLFTAGLCDGRHIIISIFNVAGIQIMIRVY